MFIDATFLEKTHGFLPIAFFSFKIEDVEFTFRPVDIAQGIRSHDLIHVDNRIGKAKTNAVDGIHFVTCPDILWEGSQVLFYELYYVTIGTTARSRISSPEISDVIVVRIKDIQAIYFTMVVVGKHKGRNFLSFWLIDTVSQFIHHLHEWNLTSEILKAFIMAHDANLLIIFNNTNGFFSHALTSTLCFDRLLDVYQRMYFSGISLNYISSLPNVLESCPST